MNEAKRKRLESAGWQVGTSDEFLDLAPEEANFIEMKLALDETPREDGENS